MRRIINAILVSLFVIGFCLANSNAPVGAKVVACETVTKVMQPYSFAKATQSTSLDAELGGVGVQLHETSVLRIQRTQLRIFDFSLQDAVKILAKYETRLFKHSLKVYDTAILSSITHPISKYYVFALRHIII